MNNPNKQLYVISADEINRIGELLKELPLKYSLDIWNLCIGIANTKKIDDQLASYELKKPAAPVAPEKAPKAKK